MADKIKDSLRASYERVKNILEIESKSIGEIFNLLKAEFCKSANISDEKWEKLKSLKKSSINLDEMAVEETTLEKTIKKLAKNIKEKNNEKEENSEEDNKKPRRNFVIKWSNSFIKNLTNMPREEGIEAVKQEITSQLKGQGVTDEWLQKPCKTITNGDSKKQIHFPEGTTFIDAFSYVMYESLTKNDPLFESIQDPKSKKSNEQENTTGEELEDDLLDPNKKGTFKKEDNKKGTNQNTPKTTEPQPGLS